MGLCIGGQKNLEKEIPKTIKAQPESIDLVKVKLKHARDRIKNFINLKNKDIEQLSERIKQKLPEFQKNKDKKSLIPLLKARKQVQKLVQNAEVRLKLINTKIDEVQLSKMTAQTVSVLDESNKYIKEIQQDLEKKDWRNVLEQAQNRYQIEWPNDSEDIQQDPAFLEMWKQIGGDKVVQKKNVKVQINKQTQKSRQNQNQEIALA